MIALTRRVYRWYFKSGYVDTLNRDAIKSWDLRRGTRALHGKGDKGLLYRAFGHMDRIFDQTRSEDTGLNDPVGLRFAGPAGHLLGGSRCFPGPSGQQAAGV